MKPFSDACENNQAPIFAILHDAFADVNANPWLVEPVDSVFTTNVLHIICWPKAEPFTIITAERARFS